MDHDQTHGSFSLQPMGGRTNPPGANAALQLMRQPSHLTAPSPSPTRHLAAIRTPEVRSAGHQPSSPVIEEQCDRSRMRYGDSTAQDPAQSERPSPTNSAMASPSSQLMGRSDSLGEGEREALLPNVDLDENDHHMSNSSASLLASTKPSTLTDSLLRGPDHDIGDAEAALEIRQRVAPDQFVKGYETSKWEIWAYYGYYVGNTGLTLAIFAPMAMQNLVSLAAGEAGVLPFMGRDRTVNSIVLLAHAISFSLQIVVFLVLGSFADFGSWRSSILIVQSLIGILVGFAWLGLYSPEQWRTGVGVYIVGLIAFQTSMAYFFAAFPALARNTPALRKKAEELNAGIIEREEYNQVDSAERNHIANVSLWMAGAGGIIVIAIMMGMLYSVDANASTENNSWGMSLIIGFGSAVWLALAMPWFVLEKRRPGQPVPPGMNIFTAGLWQVYRTGTEIWKLRQSLGYLIGYFVLGEALSTSVTVIGTLQNSVAEYNITTLAQFIMVQFASATIGLWACIKIQKKYGLTTKTMLCGVAVCIVIMNAWGMIGVWTDNLGYHNIWEFWMYGFWYGCFVNPWYSYSQTMISEVTPRGKDFLFFSLFNIIGKASSFIGPLVSSAIIDISPSHNPYTPFYFLTALTILSLGIIVFFVDLGRSRKEQDRYLEDERLERLAMRDDFRQKTL